MKIDDLLTPGRKRFTPLQRLLDQAASQEAWTQELRAILPDHLGGACQVTGIRGNTLVVVCTDGAAATRLRFLAPEIVKKLKVLAHYERLERVDISISPGTARVNPPAF